MEGGLMHNPKYISRLDKISGLSESERSELRDVCRHHAFRANDYYLSLINWDDPGDPVRRIIIPDRAELEPWGCLDASNEKLYTKVPGLEHKYEHTAVLLVNNVCGGYCRFCFRKRIFMDNNDEAARDISEGLKYIRAHRELNNILVTGGDPLVLSTKKLENIISRLREIDHVRIIRIGTKMPAFNPFRIINDPSLLEMLETYSTLEKKIYVMVHFNHPRELTESAVLALHLILKAGIVTANQTPMIRGINDSPEVLGALFDRLSFIGVPPYYVFQCRPTQGNRHLTVPVERAYEIHEQAKMRGSGLAKRSRFTMSHSLGKIEVLGLTEENIIFKFHRAVRFDEKASMVIFRRNPRAYWFDDYHDKIGDYALHNPFYTSNTEIDTLFSL